MRTRFWIAAQIESTQADSQRIEGQATPQFCLLVMLITLVLFVGPDHDEKFPGGDKGRMRTRLWAAVQIESTQAESQWIVGQAYSQHLQYLEAIKSSAKDLSLPIFEIAIDLTVRMKLGRSLYLSCNKGRGV